MITKIKAIVCIGAAAYGCYRAYDKWFSAKARIIKKAAKVVETLKDEMKNGFDLEIDDVTDVVNVNTIDSIDVGSKIKRKPRAKAPFRSWLVKIGKAKFGTPKRTEGNRLCVRKYMYDHCVEHGVIARHIWENVDIATEMVFVPTKYEMECAAVQHVQGVKDAQRIYKALGGPLPGSA
jgi:hypothetical protein